MPMQVSIPPTSNQWPRSREMHSPHPNPKGATTAAANQHTDNRPSTPLGPSVPPDPRLMNEEHTRTHEGSTSLVCGHSPSSSLASVSASLAFAKRAERAPFVGRRPAFCSAALALSTIDRPWLRIHTVWLNLHRLIPSIQSNPIQAQMPAAVARSIMGGLSSSSFVVGLFLLLLLGAAGPSSLCQGKECQAGRQPASTNKTTPRSIV